MTTDSSVLTQPPVWLRVHCDRISSDILSSLDSSSLLCWIMYELSGISRPFTTMTRAVTLQGPAYSPPVGSQALCSQFIAN